MLLTGFSTVFGWCSSIFIGFPLVNNQPIVINNYLAKENAFSLSCKSLCILFPNLHVGSFGVLSKKASPKMASFFDLSSQMHAEDFSTQYITVDQIICMVSKYGPGGLMAK